MIVISFFFLQLKAFYVFSKQVNIINLYLTPKSLQKRDLVHTNEECFRKETDHWNFSVTTPYPSRAYLGGSSVVRWKKVK